MPDEATTHYFSLHNQLVEGQQWLWETFGIIVSNAWSIDPFGCSSTMAYLLAASGINGLVIQRVHYSWKEFLSSAGAVDLVWDQDFEAPEYSLNLRVQQSPGYSVTESCGPATSLCPDYDFNEEISDAEHITFNNIRRKAEIILGLYGRVGSLSASNVALITLGSDFRFENVSEWVQQYRNYKALIEYFSGNKNMYKAQLQFGTLKTFFNHINKSNITIKGDFFPYADLNSDNSLAYWTGFYSTRPYWKKLTRSVESLLRSTEILYTLTINLIQQCDSENRNQLFALRNQYPKLVRARRNTALFQHHDGITGTAKSRVMKDYKNKLLRSLSELKRIQELVIGVFLSPRESTSPDQIDRKNKSKKRIVVYNSLANYKTEVIVLKTDYPSLIVTGPDHKPIKHQINCLYKRNLSMKNYDIAKDKFELIFVYTVPPISLSIFSIEVIKSEFDTNDFISVDSSGNRIDGLTLVNSKQKITFGQNGLIESIKKDAGNVCVSTSLKAYKSDRGFSGAYLFRPVQDQVNLYSQASEGNIIFSDGQIFKEVTAVYGKDYIITSRMYGVSSYLDEIIEIKITYNISDTNTELFIEFITDLKGTTFFTDVNGFGMRERVRQTQQPIENNYFPMTSLAYLENKDYKFAILTDHSHGVASLMDGSIEIMLDRRITDDDKRGLEEGVQDQLKTTSTLYVVFKENTAKTSELLNILGLHLNNPCSIVPMKDDQFNFGLFNFINKPLPKNIHLLNFRTISESGFPTNTALISLHNLGNCPTKNNTFPSGTYFTNVHIKSIIKTTLSGIKEEQELDELSEIKVKPFHIQSYKLLF